MICLYFVVGYRCHGLGSLVNIARERIMGVFTREIDDDFFVEAKEFWNRIDKINVPIMEHGYKVEKTMLFSLNMCDNDVVVILFIMW